MEQQTSIRGVIDEKTGSTGILNKTMKVISKGSAVTKFLLTIAVTTMVLNNSKLHKFLRTKAFNVTDYSERSSSSTPYKVKEESPELGKRMLKYFNTYRYVPSAPRFDYNPWPAKECGMGPSFDEFFKLSYDQRSRFNEDKIMYETFFKGRTNMTGHAGTFVEIGAYNGLQESNTHFFDKCLGWDGLLVEGNPINFQKVVSSREFSHKMSFAPSCEEGGETTIQFSRYPMTNAGLKGFAKTYDEKPMVNVPCGPFSPVLTDVFSGRPINFFSLDVEGAEMLVLRTIDFQKVHVDVFMIEIKNNYCQTDTCVVRMQVREKMKKEGYTRYEGLIRASDVYVHPNSTFQIPESVAMPKK